MKKLLYGLLMLTMTFCFIGCKSGNNLSSPSTPEQIAKINVESGREGDYETYLKTCPAFRVRYHAMSFGIDTNADVKTVARAMSDYYGSEGRVVEIINVNVVEQHEFTDYAMYNEWKEEYEDLITIEEVKTITEIATVNVSYSFEDVVLDDEIQCIRMGEKWYVLDDEIFRH